MTAMKAQIKSYSENVYPQITISKIISVTVSVTLVVQQFFFLSLLDAITPTTVS